MFQLACHADQGPRDNLEDAACGFSLFCCIPFLNRIAALIVADGVGGANHGEVASKLAVRRIATYLVSVLLAMTEEMATSELASILLSALERANRVILEQIAQNSRLQGMSTTAVCAVIINDELHVAWAGDSRCYLWRDGHVLQLTEDHSEVAELVRTGVLTAAEAKLHPLAHVITNNLGRQDFTPELRSWRIIPGDIIILCTDGFSDVVSEQKMADLFQQYHEQRIAFDGLPERLVNTALRLGTLDNVTVLCCEYSPDSVASSAVQRTRTAAYAVERAEACRSLFKERVNV